MRSALRGNDPVIFFEHRAMLDGAWARRPYPGDEFVVTFGEARRGGARAEGAGGRWGAVGERCGLGAAAPPLDAEVLDLRTPSAPGRRARWGSVEKKPPCL